LCGGTQASLSATKSSQSERYSSAAKELVERLGKEHREALEAQRAQVPDKGPDLAPI